MNQCPFFVAGHAVVLTILLGAAPASAGDNTPATSDEIRAAIAGNTLNGRSEGSEWWERYKEDGSLSGVWGNDYYGGAWYVDDDKFCLDYKDDSYDGCWRLLIENPSADRSKMRLLEDDGSVAAEVTLRLGNPRNL